MDTNLKPELKKEVLLSNSVNEEFDTCKNEVESDSQADIFDSQEITTEESDFDSEAYDPEEEEEYLRLVSFYRKIFISLKNLDTKKEHFTILTI